jgi:hypothetical protein
MCNSRYFGFAPRLIMGILRHELPRSIRISAEQGMDSRRARPLGCSRAHRFNVGGEAMEKIHEGGFEKNGNRDLDRCMCGAAVVQLV